MFQGLPGHMGPKGPPGLDGCNGTDVRYCFNIVLKHCVNSLKICVCFYM